ncbi:VPLPA-CTERM sorting domain-containing protein [Pseudomonadota bacterium]
MKKSKIALSLALVLGSSVASAATMTSATFTMLDATGGYVGGAADVVGAIGGGTWSVASGTAFFGQNWTAHSGTTFGPGTYSIATIEGGTFTGITVGAGQVGGHILFNWGVVADIDVVNVWDVAGDVYTSTDVLNGSPAAGDGVLGLGMIDGAFAGFNANFDFVAPAAVPVPAAVWLFGSGLLGLVGVARRKKSA